MFVCCCRWRLCTVFSDAWDLPDHLSWKPWPFVTLWWWWSLALDQMDTLDFCPVIWGLSVSCGGEGLCRTMGSTLSWAVVGCSVVVGALVVVVDAVGSLEAVVLLVVMILVVGLGVVVVVDVAAVVEGVVVEGEVWACAASGCLMSFHKGMRVVRRAEGGRGKAEGRLVYLGVLVVGGAVKRRVVKRRLLRQARVVEVAADGVVVGAVVGGCVVGLGVVVVVVVVVVEVVVVVLLGVVLRVGRRVGLLDVVRGVVAAVVVGLGVVGRVVVVVGVVVGACGAGGPKEAPRRR